MDKKALLLCIVVALLAPPPAHAGEEKKPKEKRPRLDAHTAIHGAGFRITMIHPFRGDFSEYDKLEVVRTASDVGDAVPAKAMEDYTENLYLSFQKSGAFKEVREVDQGPLAPGPSPPASDPGELAESDEAGPVEGSSPPSNGLIASRSVPFPSSPASASYRAGLNSFESPPASPTQPLANPQAVQPKRTMVIVSRVIYYQKGNRTLRAVGFGGGYARFVVRFYVYDKERAAELAMGNISGEVSTSFYSVPFLAGDAEGRDAVVGAIVNRVEVRKAAADQ